MTTLISGKTKIFGIFGDPVEQTLSPCIQNSAFDKLGLDCLYVPFHVRPTELAKAVESIRALEMGGVNITIPHKQNVMALLDDISDEARAIGAVNTIVNNDGRLLGHNTDGRGYWEGLADNTGFDPTGRTVVIIGAGGAARAIIYSLLSFAPLKVVIANRTPERARALKDEFQVLFPDIEIAALGLYDDLLVNYLKETELITNTTSIGMMGTGGDAPPVDVTLLPAHCLVSDIVYKPAMTPLLNAAREHGLGTSGGVGMLIYQGAIGFHLWTGKEAPIKAMKTACFSALKSMEELEEGG